MKNLYHVLPAFSPDYGGVGSILFEMDEVLLVYIDPHGCFGQTLYFMDPRADYFFPNIFSVGIREIDAVTGRDDLLVKKITTALSYIDAKAIVIAGTPIPMMIATDFRALEKILSNKTGLPVIALDTDGLHPYYEGQEKLLTRLVDTFVGKNEFIEPKTAEVNIIGATPLDAWDKTAVIDYREFLHKCGCKTVACWGMGNGLEYIAGANKSKLNIAVSHAAIKICKMLQERFSIPYLVGFPVGTNMCVKWEKTVRQLLGLNMNSIDDRNIKKKNANVKKILIISDQISANSLRDCLKEEYGIEDVVVHTYLGFDRSFAAQKDCQLEEENELMSILKEEDPFDIVFADSIYQELIPETVELFVNIPHVGTSGMIGWENSINIFGEKGSKYLDNIFARLKSKNDG